MTAPFAFVTSHPFDRKKSKGWGTEHLWSPTLATDHPSDEDLSPGTTGKSKGWGTGHL
jgi:hypothetical protein